MPLTRDHADRERGTLTPREQQVLAQAAQGRSNKEVAKRLGISEGTVKIHLHNVYRKTGVRNRTELTSLVHRGARLLS
jgi:DNA-binding NarL/FixJ family response regulator